MGYRILVDADACPVIPIIERIAKEYSISVILFCDTAHKITSEYSKVVSVEKGVDAVDFSIVATAKKNDIVVTQDYGLAAMVLAKGCIGINQNGRCYTEDNIDQLLFERYLAREERRKQKRRYFKSISKRVEEQNRCFERNFLRLIREKIVISKETFMH